MKTPQLAGAFLCLLGFLISLSGQTSSQPGTASNTVEATPQLNALLAATQIRSDMVAGIVNGTEDSDTALARLKTIQSPSGLQTDPDVDFSYAAIDVGHRLVAASKPADAEKFFRAAESSLAAVVQKTPDTQASDKAQYLQALSVIRSKYLDNAIQAKADIEQAIALQPDNKLLQQQRAILASEHGDLFTGGTPQG